MSESQWRRCAYELCSRDDLIEIKCGHRKKQFHNDNCRQAQHRLLQERARLADLSQLWMDFRPSTQQTLEEMLSQGLAEPVVRRFAAAIAHERDLAQQPSLSEDEQAALRQQWAELQPFTRNILEGLLIGRQDTLSLFNLILLAIGEEQRHASCNSELEQRNAYLEMTLAEYRRIVDLEGREQVEQQFMVVGELLGFRALPSHHLGQGVEKWKDYRSWTDERTLAEVVRDGKEILAEEEAAKEQAQEKSRLKRLEKELALERARREALERKTDAGAILVDQQQMQAQLARDLDAVRIGTASGDLCQTLYGQALLVVKEREQEVQHLKTRIEKQLERRIAKLQARIQELEEAQGDASTHDQKGHELSREEMVTRLLALGERLQYCRLLVPHIPPDADAWRDWSGKATDEQLRQAIASAEHYYGNLVYLEEVEQLNRQAAREKLQQKSRLHQIEQECQGLRQRIQELEATRQRQASSVPVLTAIQAYLHTHAGASLPLRRGATTYDITMLRDDEVAIATGQGLINLSCEEVEQIYQWIAAKTGALSVHRSDTGGQGEDLVLRARIAELETERAAWVEWCEAEVRGQSDLTAMRQYLQEHELATIPIQRGGVTVRIAALGEDAVAVTEDHGLIRLSDEELQQGRVWVCKKQGWPMVATKLPIGETPAQWQQCRQLEQELTAAQAENLALHHELARYLPPPRELLEASLRRWCAVTNMFFQDKVLAGEELESFLRESSEQRLLAFMKSGESCYFIGKRHQQRIALIQQHLSEVEPYQGDPALSITSMDNQGNVIFASGHQHRMDIDDINRFWARIVAGKGQQHVGGNVAVAPIQQYLCDHPGKTIPLQRGKDEYNLVLIADDLLAITTRQRLIRLYEDDLEPMLRWVRKQQGSAVS